MKESINKILYDTFLAQFGEFKSSPQAFFDSLADDITVSLFDSQTLLGDIEIDDLRHAIYTIFRNGTFKARVAFTRWDQDLEGC